MKFNLILSRVYILKLNFYGYSINPLLFVIDALGGQENGKYLYL
jgi:hypothetical protein